MDFTTLKKNLENNEFKVSCFGTAKEATEYLKGEIKNTVVGIGGSATVNELELYENLIDNNTIFWHWRIPEGKTAKDMLTAAREADVYITSANGIAETGEIINIDNNSNRVSEMMYGHKKVYIIAGKNKIEEDYEKALHRARNIAGPKNAKRLSLQTPCAKNADKCYNCNSPARICRSLCVLWKKPAACEYEVILVNENLGF